MLAAAPRSSPPGSSQHKEICTAKALDPGPRWLSLPAGVELGVNYPFPVISTEDSLAALAAADAVVQQCLRAGPGASAAPDAAAWTGATPGPFRPATDADPAEAERLFAEHYRRAGAGRPGSAGGRACGRCWSEGRRRGGDMLRLRRSQPPSSALRGFPRSCSRSLLPHPCGLSWLACAHHRLPPSPHAALLLQAARPVQRAPAAAAGRGLGRLGGRAEQRRAARRRRSGHRGSGTRRRSRSRRSCRRPCVLRPAAQRCSPQRLGGATTRGRRAESGRGAACGGAAALAAAPDCGPRVRQRGCRRQRRGHGPCHADRCQPRSAQPVWWGWRWLSAACWACAASGAAAAIRTAGRAIRRGGG